jgi:hypothetical protein
VVATSSFRLAQGEALHRGVLELGLELAMDKRHGIPETAP